MWSRASRSASVIVRGHKGAVNSARFHPSKPFLLTSVTPCANASTAVISRSSVCCRASGDTTAAITSLHVSLTRRGSDSAVHKPDEDKDVALSRSRSLPTITQTPADSLQATLVEPIVHSGSAPIDAAAAAYDVVLVQEVDEQQTMLQLPRPRARSNSFPGLSRATIVHKSQVSPHQCLCWCC